MGSTKSMCTPARPAATVSVYIWSPASAALSGGMPESSSARRTPLGLGFPARYKNGMSRRLAKTSGLSPLLLETIKSPIPASLTLAAQSVTRFSSVSVL